jgi:hypothetical protein
LVNAIGTRIDNGVVCSIHASEQLPAILSEMELDSNNLDDELARDKVKASMQFRNPG